MSIETGDVISRVYGNFRGADFRGEEINIVRSPDCLNVWKDYKHTESIRTRPGMKLQTAFSEAIYGIYFYNGVQLVHSGKKLYKVVKGVKTEIRSGLNEKVSNAFVYEGIWYFMDGIHYLQYNGTTIKDVEPYVPTTSIARKPGGGGKIHEDINLLTGKRINTFYVDGADRFRHRVVFPGAYSTSASGETTKTLIIELVNNESGAFSGDLEDNTQLVGGTAIWNGLEYEVRSVSADEIAIGIDDYNIYIHVGSFTDTVLELEGVTLHLDSYELDTDFVPVIKVNDEVYTTGVSIDYKKGRVSFSKTPPLPLTDGQDNISIEFKKDVLGYKEKILNCTLLQLFDNRVFVSGNKDYPSTVWHCSLNDPTYFSDLDYYREGMDSAQVKGIVAGNNNLWVFREPSDANTTVFYHTPGHDDEYGKVYPSSHSSVTIGCVGKAINFNDDIVFFSERGMEGISGDITTEQVAAHRSSLVDRKMIALPKYKEMILEEWEGYLLVFIGNQVFLADSRTAFTNENHIEYEWFYWVLEKSILCTRVYDNVLYLGTADGVYTLSDLTCDIESYWTTPKDKFKVPQKLKTTNKRGCVVEATGDISLYAKLEDTDFELIGTYENITDYFVSRIKKKKFKDIQLKFYSKTRFSLETATLECFIGGYIKR